MRNKLILGVVVVLVISGVWYFYDSVKNVRNQTSETTKVKIADLPVVQSLPLYVALEKGYFRDEGIDVERIKFEAPNQIIDAVMSGQVDFTSPSGAMGITGVADFKNPGKVKIYIASGGDEVIPNDSILVKTSSTLQNIQELKGKKLGILPGIQWRTIARHILVQNNLLVDQDVMLVELAPGLQAPALAAGQVDALLAIEPIPTIVKAKQIGREIVPAPTVQAIANPFYGGAGSVRVAFAEQNPHTTAKVLAAFNRAVKEIQAHPEEVRQYLKGYTPLDGSLIALAPILKFRMYNQLTASEIVAVQKFYDIFSTYQVVAGRIDFQKLLFTSNSP